MVGTTALANALGSPATALDALLVSPVGYVLGAAAAIGTLVRLRSE